MIITNEAKQYIESILAEQKAAGLRIYAVEGGCCGPQIGLSLEEPEETDAVADINGIRTAIALHAKELTESLTLDFQTEGEQSGLVMLGAPNCC